MRVALAITLFFVAATSALGGARNARIGVATGGLAQILGAIVAFGMMLWCTYLGVWVLNHQLQ